jgi:iron complex outermembrane recepter protein
MNPMRENARCVLRVAACLFTSCLMAQERDLTSMSLEDFLNIEVTSVSKSHQKLSRTAAAVYVITQDMIRRSGAVN